MDILSVGKNNIKHLVSGRIIPLNSLWEDQTCVTIFFRRWGCLLCRVWAKEVSELSPILKKHDIKLIGIGVDETGAKEFMDGKYFDGELYVDMDKQTYTDLSFKRFNYVTILTSLLWSESRAAISKGRQLNLGGDYRGDGLQNGGAFVVEKGGKLLFSFKQNGPAEHVANEDFLKALNLESEIPNLPKH